MKFKLSGLMFDVDNLSTQISNHSNLGFMGQSEPVKLRIFLYFLFFNHSKMEQIKMIGDAVYVGAKKVGTYKSGHFITMRDPSRHTFVKLNAYGFNESVLREIKKSDPDSLIHVKQKGTSIELKIRVWKALEVGQYLVFNGEKQVFVPKDKFELAI